MISSAVWDLETTVERRSRVKNIRWGNFMSLWVFCKLNENKFEG